MTAGSSSTTSTDNNTVTARAVAEKLTIIPPSTTPCCPKKELVDNEDTLAVTTVPVVLRSRKRPRTMRRLVSQDASSSESPLRCVSSELDSSVPPLPNPLDNNPKMLSTHVSALRLEADLYPMRLILTRLMAHPTLNRKAVFNSPVDPAALGLLDYHLIVTKPMDLGTIKGRLHAVAYQSRQDVANDIRLVFSNAIRYNPSHHAVHKCGHQLLEHFEKSYQALGPSAFSSLKEQEIASSTATTSQEEEPQQHPPPTRAIARMVSCVEDQKEISRELFEAISMEVDGTEEDVSVDIAKGTKDFIIPKTDAEKDAAAGTTATASSASLQIPAGTAAAGTSCTSTISTPMDNNIIAHENHPVHHDQATRARMPVAAFLPALKKKARVASFLPHSCYSCQGRTCAMCKQGCLSHEPSLLICQGSNCVGAKIRKGAMYYISKDGHRQYCQRCFTNLPPVLPNTSDDSLRYKQDLLKRKNDEEIAENWITCGGCGVGAHQVCAMHNAYVHSEASYLCPDCQFPDSVPVSDSPTLPLNHPPVEVDDQQAQQGEESYTFVSGSDMPVPLSSVTAIRDDLLTADALEECAISSFIQQKVRDGMQVIPNSGKTVVVRVISDYSRHFSVPEVVRKHFRMATDSNHLIMPPSKVNYQQKAIALFQKMDGLDVCIFCMYVQEYDGDDEYEQQQDRQNVKSSHSKRVYIAYLDSVEHFRPRSCRTQVYHEMLVAYLATARERGYQTAQIWACPPSRGNSFVFWNHPASQRTPSKERLVSWYHGALSRAIDRGVVTDVKSLFESDFEHHLTELEKEVESQPDHSPASGKMACPPLLEGDFWVEEAVRIHSASITRYLKTRSSNDVCVWNVSAPPFEVRDCCPAMQVASLIRDRIMTHPSSVPFRRPVNAAALKLKDYHKIVSKPMDLGTVYSRCILGEYHTLCKVVADVELVIANAKKYNPVGHFVHVKANEISDLFFQELAALTTMWNTKEVAASESSFLERHANMSMSLDVSLNIPYTPATKPATSVVIEDDRSSDGSRSLSSSSATSMPASPMSGVSLSRDEDDATRIQQSGLTLSATDGGASIGKKLPTLTDRKKSRKKSPPPKLELLTGGPEAVHQRMVGDDTWLLDKRNPLPPKGKISNKKKPGPKRRRIALSNCDDNPPPKRRRQAWLGEEVGESVRKMRTSFFTCSLAPKPGMSDLEREKLDFYQSYVGPFSLAMESDYSVSSHIADARHALLEFSQYRHFEFDTLRRAKYSTAMLLYHLHHDDAPGMVPICTCCDQEIQEVRWHKVKKVGERRRCSQLTTSASAPQQPIQPKRPEWERQELCSCCHSKHARASEFIPIPVSMKF
jgi:hypothetical protein